jgi:PAS domain S-box-containing protein
MLDFLPEAQGKASRRVVQLDRFFTLSLDMLCAIGSEGYFEEINPRWQETLGFTKRELFAQPWLHLIHPDDRRATLAKLRKLASDIETISFKNRCRCADGSYKWLLWNATCDDESRLIYAVVRDITEFQQSKQALRDSEERFRCLVENVKDYAIYMLDPQGRTISWNQGAERINGYREEEILGQSVACLYPPEEVAVGKPEQELSIAAAVGRFENESYRVRRDGSRFCAHTVLTALQDKYGRLRGFAKVVRDITERKQAEEALHRAYDELERRVEERTAALSQINQRLREEIAERELAETELRRREGQLRQQTQQLQQTLQELKQTQAQLVQSEKMSSLGQLVAGIAHEINNPVNFITGNLGHATLYIRELLELLALYRQHHPQPASAIQVRAEEMDLDFVTEDLPKLLHSMKVGADRINQLVLSLRNFSHLDTVEHKPIDIHKGIEDTLLILQNRLKAKGQKPAIAIVKEYGNLPPIDCYGGQLNQVFMNILNNAIDAIEESVGKQTVPDLVASPARVAGCESAPTLTMRVVGRGSLQNLCKHCPASDAQARCSHLSEEIGDENSPASTPQIRIRTELLDKDWVAICITDNGGGMSESVQQQLFDPFFTTKPVGKGTGLGLSISYQIVVEKHGGQLRCLSSPGRGTEFIIEIPLWQGAQECGGEYLNCEKTQYL